MNPIKDFTERIKLLQEEVRLTGTIPRGDWQKVIWCIRDLQDELDELIIRYYELETT